MRPVPTRVHPALLAGAIAASLAWAAAARAERDGGAPILHEYFEYARPSSPAAADDLPALPRPGALATQDARPTDGDGASAAPASTLSAAGPIPAPGRFDADSGGLRNGPGIPDGEVTLDSDTGPEGLLHYDQVFTPAIVPFKRAVVVDQVTEVGGTVSLRVSDPRETEVPVGGAPHAAADLFAGRVTVLANPGEPVPLPSVAPGMRVHALQVFREPGSAPAEDVVARITRDAADNHFVRLSVGGRFVLRYEVSAPRSYFGGELRDDGTAPPTGPGWLAERAGPVLEAAGVRPGMTELQITRVLTAWFRGFDAAPLSARDRSGDPFLDTALARRGVCRHRAFGFVVAAGAAGLRARYVYNEAHAFVEVHLGGSGWRRIDLGGASEGVRTADERGPTYDPGTDPFDPPSTGPDGRGADEPTPGASEPTSEHPVASGEAANPPHSPSGLVEDAPQTRDHPGAAAPQSDPSRAPEAQPEPSDSRMETRLDIAAPARAYRGETILVSGRLQTRFGDGLSGREIAIELTDGDEVTWLGVTLTDANGSYAAELELPTTAATGARTLRAAYAGDGHTRPAESR